jgi:hypothetical protein
MQKLYSTIYKSVVRAASDLVEQIETTMPGLGIRYWSWEDRSDEDKLPRVPLLGVNGFAFDENRGLWIIRFGITLSTVDDANLLLEADLIDMIREIFGEDKKIALRDPDDGEIISELVSVDCKVMPMGQTQLRNYRSLGIEMRRTAA